jgi:hypothetical protein
MSNILLQYFFEGGLLNKQFDMQKIAIYTK